jgi:hypothetical protein
MSDTSGQEWPEPAEQPAEEPAHEGAEGDAPEGEHEDDGDNGA